MTDLDSVASVPISPSLPVGVPMPNIKPPQMIIRKSDGLDGIKSFNQSKLLKQTLLKNADCKLMSTALEICKYHTPKQNQT